MVGGLIAANSSTILTHLNWGASYLVHDFYRRFIRPDATRSTTCWPAALATVLLFVAARRGMVFVLDIGARTRSTSSCRSAPAPDCSTWCAGSGGGSTRGAKSSRWCQLVPGVDGVARSRQERRPPLHARALVVTVAFTSVCWLVTAYVAPETDRQVLVDFYLKTRPAGPGWEPIQADPRVARSNVSATLDNIPLALAGWVAGCAMVWSSLFTVGNFLYGRTGVAVALLAVALGSSAVLLRIIPTLWADSPEEAATAS